LLFAIPLGVGLVAWVAALLALSTIYSLLLKGTVLLGNATVALCASSPVLYGAAVTGEVGRRSWIAAALIGLFMLCYEVVKTIADREPDGVSGLRTVATVLGGAASLRILTFLLTVLATLTLSATMLTSHVAAYAVAAVAFLIPVGLAPLAMRRSLDADGIRRGVLMMRIAWLIGLIALWLLR